MAHAISSNEPLHMGAPVPHGKLAMWIFLATEIMFFTALIGTYSILRNGQPSKDEPWPKPHEVHLLEWFGALNTFVLICSSVSVVLAHWTLCRGQRETGGSVHCSNSGAWLRVPGDQGLRIQFEVQT